MEELLKVATGWLDVIEANANDIAALEKRVNRQDERTEALEEIVSEQAQLVEEIRNLIPADRVKLKRATPEGKEPEPPQFKATDPIDTPEGPGAVWDNARESEAPRLDIMRVRPGQKVIAYGQPVTVTECTKGVREDDGRRYVTLTLGNPRKA